MASQTILKFVAIVDDDELMRSALRSLLQEAGMPALAFASAEEFLEDFNLTDPAL